MAQTVTIGEQKVYPESESLKFSATPTPQVENPSDSTTLVCRQTLLESGPDSAGTQEIERARWNLAAGLFVACKIQRGL